MGEEGEEGESRAERTRIQRSRIPVPVLVLGLESRSKRIVGEYLRMMIVRWGTLGPSGFCFDFWENTVKFVAGGSP